MLADLSFIQPCHAILARIPTSRRFGPRIYRRRSLVLPQQSARMQTRRSRLQCCIESYNETFSDLHIDNATASTSNTTTPNSNSASGKDSSVESCNNSCRSWPELNPILTSFLDPEVFWNPGEITSSPLWRYLLMGDGHTALHLQLLTGDTVRLVLLESTPISQPEKSSYFVEHAARTPLFQDMPKPWYRRQVQLTDQRGIVLIHATSWWDAVYYNKLMIDNPNITTWEALNSCQLLVCRGVLGLYFGYCAALEDDFKQPGPFWGRDFVFRKNRRPIIIINEIFSPALQIYMGKMSHPKQYNKHPPNCH